MTGVEEERRDTALARKLKERIAREGPITVAAYVEACLQDPEHGYYRVRRAIGAGGDFVTAPEISQVFGELIGLWCAVVWQEMGAPARVDIVELGPGRGTLMRDALRAARKVPAFHHAVVVHFVETSAVLRAEQRAMIGEDIGRVTWHETPRALMESATMDRPVIVVANEFLDALPVEQYVYGRGAWHRRRIGLDARGELCFDAKETGTKTPPRALPAEAVPREGDIIEVCRSCEEVVAMLAAHAERSPMAALIVDYGHTGAARGDTLQAVSGQRYVSPFLAPGEMDLSHQVDFGHLTRLCRDRAAGLAVDGPVTQAAFLGSLGIMERASRLMAANPGDALAIETAVARLMSPAGMGTRFKVMGLRNRDLPPLPGFASAQFDK